MKVQMLRREDVLPDPNQPRKFFDREALQRLADSIKERSLMKPISVRWDAQREKWVIVSGERRFLACGLVGIDTLPCRIVEGELSEAEILGDQLEENLQAESFKAMELARGFDRLMRLTGCKQSEIAGKLHISNATVSRALSLLLLPADLQDKVGEERGMIPSSTAAELVGLPDEATMRQWAGLVMGGKATRSQVQEARHALVGKKAVTPRGNKITLDVEVGESHYRLVITNGEALALEGVASALSVALKKAKKATSIEELKGEQP